MQYVYLNCSNLSICEIVKKENPIVDNTVHILISSFSLLGIILNSITAFIFIFSNNSSTKFLKFLKFYSLNSLGISLNDFSFINYYLFTNNYVYIINNKFYNESNLTPFIVYLNFFVFFSTFSGMLDIFIVYERIQIYLRDLKFLRNKSAAIISFCVLLYSIVLNIPIGIAREICDVNISIESNVNITIYCYKLREFHYNNIYLISIFVFNFMRDIMNFIIEIILNIVLMLTMRRYYNNRMALNISNMNLFEFRRTDTNNAKIALFLNFISAFFHMTSFSTVILIKYFSFSYFHIFSKIIILAYTSRHSMNIFLFLKLNKKFRRNFYALIPRCMIRLRNRRVIAPQNNPNMINEHINLQTCTTYL